MQLKNRKQKIVKKTHHQIKDSTETLLKSERISADQSVKYLNNYAIYLNFNVFASIIKLKLKLWKMFYIMFFFLLCILFGPIYYIIQIPNYFLLHLFILYLLIQMFSTRAVLLITIFVIHSFSLHMLDNTQAEIDALKQQQSAFEGRVNKLINNITQIQKNLNRTSNIDQKVLILQNAITSQREQVFNLSTVIIPPFNITKQGCEKMTDQQKVELLEQLAKAKTQVNQLKTLAAGMPKCDDIEQVKKDIEKQIFFLNSIQSIIYTNCSMNVILSPTIFQTNIYADNWVLGNMTIDDLIEQYYQRSIRYDNITNCPIQNPFFDGNKCVNCSGLVFDISQKKCTPCPPDSTIDNVKRVCVPNKYYTEWNNVTNFVPIDGPFPTPDPAAKPCPADKPYYNGTKCIPCVLPNFFNIQTQQCEKCPAGQVYDTYDRQCSVPLKNKLTNLASRWVTGPDNFTNVLKERSKILQDNVTSKNYDLCPPETPYFDQIKCINCDKAPYLQFDLNTNKCVTAPNTTQFNPNIHNYIPVPAKPLETAPNATNLLGSLPPSSPSVQDCPADKPYWDGLACILCPEPFPLFDTASNTCVACDPKDYYDAKGKKCTPRPVIYIPQREDNLLATPNVTIPDYKNNITNTIKNNPEAIIGYCDSKQNSDYKSCFPCDNLFNVQTFQCDVCTDTYNKTTGECKKIGEIYTNYSSPNSNLITNLPDRAKQVQRVNDLLQANNQSTVCPTATPYRTATQCVSCKQTPNKVFFNFATKTCEGCDASTTYLNGTTCVPYPTASNIAAMQQVPYINPDNLLKQQQRIADLNASKIPYFICNDTKYPYYKNGACTSVTCQNSSQVYDFSKDVCVACENYNATNHTCPPPPPPPAKYPYIESNWTDSNWTELGQRYNTWKSAPNATECPAATPHYNATSALCVSCAPDQIFSYDNYTCLKCVDPYAYDLNIRTCIKKDPLRVTKFPDAQNLIYGGVSKGEWQTYYDKNKTAGYQDCNYDATNQNKTQYYDGIACITCPDGYKYFNMEKKICLQQCPAGSTYSNGNCVSDSTGATTQSIGPDIAKMYANVF